MSIHDSRTAPFKNSEFIALERSADGRLVDLPGAFPWLTEAQRSALENDDISYCEDLDEEVRCMLAEFL